MSEMKGTLIIGKEWTPRNCPLTVSFVQKEFAIKLARRGHPVYFTVLSATKEDKDDAERNGVRLILPNPEQKIKIHERHMFILHKETFPDLKNCKPISVIFGQASENGTAQGALAIRENLFEDAIFIPFYYDIPEDMGLDPKTLQKKADEMMEYAKAAFAIVSVGTNVYQHNEDKYGHLNKENHLPYIPWVGEDFESFEALRTTAGKKKEVYSVHTVHEIKSIQALEAAAVAMGKVAHFYKYDDFRPLWKIRGIPNECCGECKRFLNDKAGSNILKINMLPPSADRIKQDFEQCHLLVVFTPNDDPFGMVGLLGCAAGVPSLVSKSTGFASFIEAEFPEFNSVVCDIEPADTTEGASEKWEKYIMKNLKKYDVACKIEQALMAKLHKEAQDGIIAEYQKNLLDLVSKLLEDETTKTADKEYTGMGETATDETPAPSEKVQGAAEESNYGSNENGDNKSILYVQNTLIGIVEVSITVTACTPIVDLGVTLVEEIKKEAMFMLNEIRTQEDLPHVQAHLQSLGPVTVILVKKKSLCVVVHCETSESVKKLWIDYRRGKLQSLFTEDIASVERLQRYRVSSVSLKVSLPRWQYRQAVVQLKYLKEGYEPEDASSDLCQVCGKMIETEDEITPYVVVELERYVSESDERKAELTKILRGGGTYETDIPVQTRDKEVSSVMLFEEQTPHLVSTLAKERPEILGALGINRYLNLNTNQLSRVRSEESDGKSCQYDATELKAMIERSGVAIFSEELAQQQDSDLRERLFRIVESPATNTYLHTVTLMYDEHKIRQQLKSIERDYTSLQDQYQTMEVNHEEIVKKEEEKLGKLGTAITKLTEEKRTLLKIVDEIINPESERKQSVDTNIEEFSFKFDDIQQSYEEILQKLPCHFTWNQDVDVNFRCEYLMSAADDMLKHHGDLAPVPNKALKGYLYVSKLRPKDERDPRAALKWFDEALADNKKELGRCDDNDGPLGDKLVILADIAWVHFSLGETVKVRERLNEIANLFVGKLTKKRRSYMYGHKGVASLYFRKGANDEGIDCLQRALLAFPKKIDWLVLLAFLLLNKKKRIFGDRKCREASTIVCLIKDLAEEVLEINPNHGCAMAVLGQLYTDMDPYDDAKPYVERALELHPTSPIILSEVLKFLIRSEDYDRALNVVHNAIEHKPESPELTDMLGQIYVAKYQRHPSLEINRQLLSKALLCYDEAIKFAGGVFHHAVLSKAGVLNLMNKRDETKEMLTQLIDGGTLSGPFYTSWAYFALARTYKSLNDDKNCWLYLNESANLGSEYRDGKRAARFAIRVLEKRLERESKNETVLRELGSMHMKLREFEKACEYHLKILNP